MSNHVAMVSIDTVIGIMNDSKQTMEPYRGAEVYEAGMVSVITDIAKTHLLNYEYSGSSREAYDRESDKASAMFKEFSEEHPGLYGKLDEFHSQHGYVNVQGEHAAFIDGFIAAYRFLKQIKPD